MQPASVASPALTDLQEQLDRHCTQELPRIWEPILEGPNPGILRRLLS